LYTIVRGSGAPSQRRRLAARRALRFALRGGGMDIASRIHR